MGLVWTIDGRSIGNRGRCGRVYTPTLRLSVKTLHSILISNLWSRLSLNSLTSRTLRIKYVNARFYVYSLINAAQPWILSNHDIQRHVRAYASLHNLNANDYQTDSQNAPVTSYSTRVESLRKIQATHTWRLTLRKLERLPESNRIKAHWWTEDVDAVVRKSRIDGVVALTYPDR